MRPSLARPLRIGPIYVSTLAFKSGAATLICAHGGTLQARWGLIMHNGFWHGKRVLITGHTGFKGSWLSLWLTQLGAEVHGIALPPDTSPSIFELINLAPVLASSTFLDIREADRIAARVEDIAPQIVFHLAAQPLVRRSYDSPLDTISTNVLGTANVLNACRNVLGLKAVVVVTTDKVYDNQEWHWPYRESDRLGGKDPYSASKAACEIIVASYRDSFLAPRGVSVTTARGGNVIGGGDWSEDRLIPDAIRAAFSGSPLEIRAPNSVRPWQHVLGLCHAYLQLVDTMLSQVNLASTSWNFGPLAPDCVSVARLLDQLAAQGIAPDVRIVPTSSKPESGILELDSSLARSRLGWQPALDLPEALAWTADWYLAAHRGENMRAVTESQIATYQDRLS